MNIKDLVFLEDGTIIENKSYGVYVVGHSSEIATWVKIWESSRYSINELKELVNKVWDKIPTPLFEVVYRLYSHKLDSINKLQATEVTEGIQVRMDDVTFTTSNPFVLSEEDLERVQTAIEEYKQQRDAEWVIKDAHRKVVGKEMLSAIRTYVESNPTFKLVEKVYKDEVSIHSSKIIILANGVEVAKVNFMDFVKQVFPELWEKYNNS